MWDKIRRFFAWLFGFQTNTPAQENPQIELIEDAADLGDMEIVSEEAPTPDEMKVRRTRGLGLSTRGLRLDVGEVIDVDDEEDEAAPPAPMVSITNPRFVWCLDNGHGRLQKGKRSPRFADGSQFEEWEFNRDVIKRMLPKLDQAGVQYFVVVPETEVGSFLRERVQRANSYMSPLGLPKIFLSVHANAFGMSNWANGKTGIEVWYYPGSDVGMRLASAFQSELMKALPDWRDRGIKSHQRGSRRVFYVLGNTNMPAVLTENGFYTDETEAALLMRPEIRQKIADAHVNAILKVEQEGYQDISMYRPNMIVGG